MACIENWLIEGVEETDADIRSDTIKDLKRNLPTKGCRGDVVKDITDILEGEQPAMGRGTSPIHDSVDPGLDGSLPPISWILVLMVGLRLPIIDVIGPDYVLDLVGDLILGCITHYLVHSTVTLDIVFQKVLTNCFPDLNG